MSMLNTKTQIVVTNEWEVAKVLAFARARVPGVVFGLSGNLVPELVRRAEAYAREHDLRVGVSIVSASDTRVLAFGATGLVAGAGIGFAVGGAPGALVGAIAGATAGVALAHVMIHVHVREDGAAIVSLS